MDALLRRREMIAAIGGSPTPSIQPVFYDRLVFDGTAYIDTDIVPPTDASFRVRIGGETLKATQRCFGLAATTGTIGMHLATNTNSTTRYFNVYYGQSSTVWSGAGPSFNTSVYRFFITPQRVGWGSSTNNAFTKGAGTPSGGLKFGANTSHSGQAFTGVMETFEVFGDDAKEVTTYDGFGNYTPVYTLRPCTYNGEAGLWCVETSKFYGNTAGAGALSVTNNS